MQKAIEVAVDAGTLPISDFVEPRCLAITHEWERLLLFKLWGIP